MLLNVRVCFYDQPDQTRLVNPTVASCNQQVDQQRLLYSGETLATLCVS